MRARSSSRRGARARRRCTSTPALRPGLVFMTLHFPDQVDTNVLTIEATDPRVGHRRVQGHGRAHREAACPGAGSGAWNPAPGGPVDLHLTAAAATDEERAAVDELLGAPDVRLARRRPRRGRPTASPAAAAPRATSATCCCRRCTRSRAASGWISEGGLNYVCERLTVPPAEAYGVATFYAMFSVEPRPATVVHVCDDLACRVGGAEAICAHARGRVRPGRARPRRARRAPGCAARAWACASARPRSSYQRAGAGAADAARRARRRGAAPPRVRRGARLRPAGSALPQIERPCELRLLRRVGVVDPDSFDDYHAHGGYAGAPARGRARRRRRRSREVTDAKLMGRGGAAFPTGVKWKAVAEQPVQPALLHLQRRRVGARHVQGPHRDGARSLRA